MGKCSICAAEIQSGTHHESTTTCIRILCDRIAALERLVGPPAVPLPFLPPH